ncbi:hypothetical protein CCH79_00020209 [Gambusia affinis]|uniref:Dickkopf-related protein 1/2/4 C-terminal subdomain 1 domain-containing protein n=1 Tax=Gambusia affinis TaxID=33528 RepID=A0A315UX85_GAMAF|nr:hypothetical protein CCH79_00020209 [Gambusia affinis]
MSSCVRSGDCAAGLCCVRYLTGKRCQRIPLEGEACLLWGATKRRRNLGRCDCAAGLGKPNKRSCERLKNWIRTQSEPKHLIQF